MKSTPVRHYAAALGVAAGLMCPGVRATENTADCLAEYQIAEAALNKATVDTVHSCIKGDVETGEGAICVHQAIVAQQSEATRILSQLEACLVRPDIP